MALGKLSNAAHLLLFLILYWFVPFSTKMKSEFGYARLDQLRNYWAVSATVFSEDGQNGTGQNERLPLLSEAVTSTCAQIE